MTEDLANRVSLHVDSARALGRRALIGAGFNGADADILVDHMMDAALCGYEYSGLPKILNVIEFGAQSPPTGPMRLRSETPVSASYEGGNNNGMLTIYHATRTAIAKAESHGIAIVGVNDTWMSGRSAYYVEMIARAGLVGIHTVSSRPQVAPMGGAAAALGTNPIAFGFPTEADPFVLDMGTSAIMATDLQHRQRLGESIPDDVALDPRGQPTRDPTMALLGALLPFGNHKGFGLALALQALSLLSTAETDDSDMKGYIIIAIRPDLMIPLQEYRHKISLSLARVKATPRRPGVDDIRIPSENSFRQRARNLREGIVIDGRIHDALLQWAAKG